MAEWSRDMRGARILVTNDDGVHAPGLKVLEDIARCLSDDVWVVAPETEQSGASHSLTINRPLRLREYEQRRFGVDGMPTDCVLLAINYVLRDHKPDIVLSGVNHGSNLGEDVTYSGTIAATMEATLLGVPAIALSQHIPEGATVDWTAAQTHAPDVIRKAVSVPWLRNVLVNVNFPAGPVRNGIKVVRYGKRKIADELTERVDPRGRTYFWIGTLRGYDDVADDTDIATVLDGGISVTQLYLDLTHRPTVDILQQAFA